MMSRHYRISTRQTVFAVFIGIFVAVAVNIIALDLIPGKQLPVSLIAGFLTGLSAGFLPRFLNRAGSKSKDGK